MPSYICVTSCVWGPKPKYRKRWEAGEPVQHEECPNKHFEPTDPFEKQFTDEGIAVPGSSMELNWGDFTKEAINQRFELGYTIDALLKIRKKQLIAEAKEVLKEEY